MGFERCRRLLELSCLLFVAIGLAVAVAGGSPLFAMWNVRVAEAFVGGPDYGSLGPLAAMTRGIVGGSIVGKWLAAWWIVRHPLRQRQRWAWHALWAGLLSWWTVDSLVSVAHGAAFNVWMINVTPLLIVGGLLWALRPGLRPTGDRVPTRLPRGWRGMYWTSVVFVGVGLVVAFALTSPLFDVYRGLMGRAYYPDSSGGGSLPGSARAYLGFIAGPIGGTFLAHFLMLAWALRAVGAERPRWLYRCVVGSILGWFVVDSTMSLVHGAAFNVAMINVPTLVAMAVPLVAAHASRLGSAP